MAPTTHLALFGPVFCPYPFPTLPALSSIASGSCCLFVLAIVVVVVIVVIIKVSEEVVVVVLVIDVVVVLGCYAKYLIRENGGKGTHSSNDFTYSFLGLCMPS